MMAEQQRAFKGVWIPAEIWLNENLSLQEKAVLAEIDSFCSRYESCYASNEHFAKFIGVSTRRIKDIIKSLEDKKLIERELVYKKGSKEIEKRLLRVPYPSCRKLPQGGEENFPTPSEENCPDNNTSMNNTSNKKSGNPDYAQEREEIIGYLNEKSGKAYRPNSDKTKKLISARLNEEFTVDDFKTVIDNKVSSWLGNKDMEKFLRPETLFSSKFEGYLNEKSFKQQTQSDSGAGSTTLYI